MKRLFNLLLIFVMVFVLVGCDGNGKTFVPIEGDEVSEYVLKEEEACFRFFWETQATDEGLPSYGLIPDRYPSNGLASIASVGFGLAGFPIGVENKWITKEEGKERTIKTLRSIKDLDRIEGFYYHFYFDLSGKPAPNTEISVIDTALFIGGAITAGEYFGGEAKELAYEIYEEINWPWYVNPKTKQFYMSYDPVKKKHAGAWDVYGEQLLMYFLAAGSPTHPVGKDVYDGFRRIKGTYGGYTYIHSWFGSIFTHQFSHAFVDFRNIVDADGVDWFENSVLATKAARQYCIDNPQGFIAFSANSWGLTACDTPKGYSGKLGNPPSGGGSSHQNDGTVALAGSAGSMPFLPKEVEASINYYYTLSNGKLVGEYGLYDAYNLENNHFWVAKDVIGIDKGITLLMIENYRTGTVWKYFNQSPIMERAIEVLGFVEK